MSTDESAQDDVQRLCDLLQNKHYSVHKSLRGSVPLSVDVCCKCKLVFHATAGFQLSDLGAQMHVCPACHQKADYTL